MELGNLQEAGRTAARFIDENPDLPAAMSTMADIACRTGDWQKAEEFFSRAALLHEDAGDQEGAVRLRTGPLYRLAEARDDLRRCMDLCAGGGELGEVLLRRSRRMSGKHQDPVPPETGDLLVQRLALLENAWSGGSPGGLPDIAEGWGGTEPEWRWRFIVEGIRMWKDRDLDVRPWRRPLKETACPVLDPRFNEEWRNLRP